MVRSKLRWRTVRRVVVVLLVVPAVLLGVRLVWGFEAERRMAATRAGMKERGLREDVRAIAGDMLEADENATVVVMLAAGMLKLNAAEQQAVAADGNGAWLIYRPLGLPAAKQHIADAREKNLGVMMALDEAREREKRAGRVWWDVEMDLAKSAAHQALPQLRAVGNLLIASALLANEEGNDVEALEDVRRMMTLARVLARHPDMQVHLTGQMTASLAAQTLERLQRVVVLNEGTEKVMRELVGMMLDDGPFVAGLRDSLEYEVLKCPGLAERMYPAFGAWWIRPLRTRAVERAMEELVILREAAGSGRYGAVEEMLPSSGPPRSNVDAMTRAFGEGLSPSRQVVEMPYRVMTDRRAGALLAGLRVYAYGHGGAYPKGVEELVPGILGEAPRDPFSVTGERMRFRAEGDGSGLIVWSAGRDLRDDNGSDAPGTSGYGPYRWRMMDTVYGPGVGIVGR